MGPAGKSFLLMFVDLPLWCPGKSQRMKAYLVPRLHASCCEYRKPSEPHTGFT